MRIPYVIDNIEYRLGDVLNYLRDTNELSASDKEKMLGGAIRKVLRWPRLSDGATEPVALG